MHHKQTPNEDLSYSYPIREDLYSDKNPGPLNLAKKIKYLFLKTYFDTEDTSDFPGRPILQTYGPDINALDMFKPERGFCIPTIFTVHEQDYLNEISKKSIAKKFIGWPRTKSRETFFNGLRWLYFVGSFFLRVPLNLTKLGTEILPGLFVALGQSIEESIYERFIVTKDPTRQTPDYDAEETKGQKFARTLLQLISLPARLVYFAGKAATSPMKNARHAWGIFNDWRNDANKAWKAAGWFLGGLAFLYSILNTALIYAFASPYLLLGLSKASIGSIPYVGQWLVQNVPAVYSVAQNAVAPFTTAYLSQGISYIAPYIGNLATYVLTLIATQPLALIAGAIPAVIGNPIRKMRHLLAQCCGCVKYLISKAQNSSPWTRVAASHEDQLYSDSVKPSVLQKIRGTCANLLCCFPCLQNNPSDTTPWEQPVVGGGTNPLTSRGSKGRRYLGEGIYQLPAPKTPGKKNPPKVITPAPASGMGQSET